jgi:hypothetical protein
MGALKKEPEKRLTKKFFRERPVLFRKLMAYRLLWLLFPPELSRLLPRYIIDRFLTFPFKKEWAFDFPPGWNPDIWTYLDWLWALEHGLIAPQNLSLFDIGIPRALPRGLSLFWFYEPWIDLNVQGWETYLKGTGNVYTSANHLILEGYNSGDIARCSRTETRSFGNIIDVKFSLLSLVDNEDLWFYLYTGEYLIWLHFLDPATLEYCNPGMPDSVTIDNFHENSVEVEINKIGNTGSIKINGNIVAQDSIFVIDSSNPGLEKFEIDDFGQYQVGPLTIEEK